MAIERRQIQPKRRFVFLNGPAGSGKDYIARAIRSYQDKRDSVKLVSFAAELKRRTHVLYGIDGTAEENEKLHGREWKDTPISRLGGATPRQLYIRVSEDILKPALGKEAFGRILLDSMRYDSGPITYICTDSGFVDEAWPIVQSFRLQNCLRVQVEREGSTFDGDSRSYWNIPEMAEYTFNNKFDGQTTDDLEGMLFVGNLNNLIDAINKVGR